MWKNLIKSLAATVAVASAFAIADEAVRTFVREKIRKHLHRKNDQQ